jgi:hypothetical protein
MPADFRAFFLIFALIAVSLSSSTELRFQSNQRVGEDADRNSCKDGTHERGLSQILTSAAAIYTVTKAAISSILTAFPCLIGLVRL